MLNVHLYVCASRRKIGPLATPFNKLRGDVSSNYSRYIP